MPFAYYDRLSPDRQRTYRKSDAIDRLDLPPAVAAGAIVQRLRERLEADDRAGVEKAAQALVAALVEGYQVPPIRMRVLARRPADGGGELHGLYEPEDGPTLARVTVWMRTAARKQVVAFRTFLRTVVHEVCHHLDYEMYRLPETFHTEGFYKRESTLAAALFAQEEAAARAAAPQRPLL